MMEIWYRIPEARNTRVKYARLTRFALDERLWDAWCDSIRVLMRVLGADGPWWVTRTVAAGDLRADRDVRVRIRVLADSAGVRMPRIVHESAV